MLFHSPIRSGKKRGNFKSIILVDSVESFLYCLSFCSLFSAGKLKLKEGFLKNFFFRKVKMRQRIGNTSTKFQWQNKQKIGYIGSWENETLNKSLLLFSVGSWKKWKQNCNSLSSRLKWLDKGQKASQKVFQQNRNTKVLDCNIELCLLWNYSNGTRILDA